MDLSLSKRVALHVGHKLQTRLCRTHPLRQLFWECTLRCNAFCRHCGSDCRKTAGTKDMPLKDFLGVLDTLVPQEGMPKEVDPHKVMIVLTGGEPLMRPDLEVAGREFTLRGFPWSMVTNGLLLTPKRFDALLDAGLRSLTISLDGLESDHDWMRGVPGGHTKAVAAIKYAVQAARPAQATRPSGSRQAFQTPHSKQEQSQNPLKGQVFDPSQGCGSSQGQSQGPLQGQESCLGYGLSQDYAPSQGCGPLQEQSQGPLQGQGFGPSQGCGPLQGQGFGPSQGCGPLQGQSQGPLQGQGFGPSQGCGPLQEQSHGPLQGQGFGPSQGLQQDSGAEPVSSPAASDLVFDVVTCANRRNLSSLPQLRDALISYGVTHWRIFTVFPVGRAAQDPDLQLDAAQFKQLMEFIRQTRIDNALHVSYGCEGFLGPYELEVRDHPFYCAAGLTVASVLANGDISACPSIRSHYAQGNIYRDNFYNVWQNRYQAYRDRSWMRTGPCATCTYFTYCQGNGLHLRNDSGELLLCRLPQLL